MNILKQMEHNLYGPNRGVCGNSMDTYYKKDIGYGNSLHDTYGHKRGSIDSFGRIYDNNGLSNGFSYKNNSLYDNFGSRTGHADQFGRLRDNLGRDMGFNIR